MHKLLVRLSRSARRCRGLLPALCVLLLAVLSTGCSPKLERIEVTAASATIAAGTTLQLVATGTLSDGTTQELTSTVTWTSSAEAVATISNAPGQRGLVSALTKGGVTFTAAQGDITATYPLQVSDAALTSITVNPPVAAIAKGTGQAFTATGTFSNNTTQDITAAATWSTSDAAIATLSEQGSAKVTATGVLRGVSTISAALMGKSGAASLVVTDASLSDLAIAPQDPTLAKGTTLQFTATGRFSDGTSQDLSTVVTWGASDTAVATISNAAGSRGLATTLKKGEAIISATFGGKMVTTKLTVSDASLVSIAVTPAVPLTAKGTTLQFTATGTYSDGTTQDLTTAATWASADTAVATISNAMGTQGLASAVAKGQSAISASLSGKSGSVTLTVTDATLSGITVTPQGPMLAKGTTLQLTATGTYSDGSTQDLTSLVTWASVDAAVASVANAAGSRGVVTAVAKGMTSVSATLSGKSGAVTVTVSDATLSSITVTPAAPVIAKGTKQQLSATGTYSDGTTQDLTQSVTWASANTLVASVSNAMGSQGAALAVAKGTSTISATLGGKSGSATLTVTDASLTSITVNPQSPALAKGTTLQLSATGVYSDGSTQDLTSVVTWASVDAALVAVSNAAGSRGLITAVAKGMTSVSATQGAVSGAVTVTVSDATLSTIAVAPATAAIAKGTKQQYSATGIYSDGSTQDLTATATWASSDSNVATISNAMGSQGLAVAVAKGASSISASASGKSGSAALTVTDATLSAIAVTPQAPSVPQATKQQFVATGTYSDGTTQDITSLCTWTSSNTAIASISNTAGSRGQATTLARGSTVITATLGAVSGTSTMTVVLPTITTLRFATPVEYAIGGNFASGPVLGDFNADGKVDAAVADVNGNTVVMLLGNGDGTFTKGASIASGGTTSYTNTRPVDLNGDGKLDLIVANLGSANFSVLFGNGNGTLQAAQLYSAGARPFGIALGDLNADGKLDLVNGNNNGGTTVGLRLGNGTGVFPAAATPLTVNVNPDLVTLADMNNDGKLDVVASSSSSNNVSLLLGNGNGTFQALRNVALGAPTIGDVVAADLNGDGKLDLALSDATSTRVVLGNGNGTFGAVASYTAGGVCLVSADLDNDGKLDLVSTSVGQLHVLLGKGDGTFQTVVRFTTGASPYRLATADLNGDGKVDVLVSDLGNVGVLMNTSM